MATETAIPVRNLPLPARQARGIGHGGAWLWAGYTLFVIYGSLVPLDFRALPPEAAWRAFANMPFLILGIESRADWIANGVLYLPLGFFTVLALRGRVPGFGRAGAAAIAAVFALSLALGVEFSQLFFPPRTVSLNDLLAEALGAAAGILIATLWMHRVSRVLATIRDKSGALAPHLLEAYALAFVLLGLFPYDFLLSGQEIADKLASGRAGWGFAAELTADGWMRTVLVSPAVETLLAFPVGLLVARLHAGRRRYSFGYALLCGALLGALMETLQFFVASGYSQGVSVLTRAAAFGLAAMAWEARAGLGPSVIAALVSRLSPVLLPAYIAALAAASGLMRGGWDIANVPAVVADLRYMPFYYHYFTSEAKALNSLLGISLMYAPVGVFCWAWKREPGTSLAIAALLAFGVEAAKATLPALRPDPTNLLVAATAAWVVAQLMKRVGAAVRPPVGGPVHAAADIGTAPQAAAPPAVDAQASPRAAAALVTFADMPVAHKALLAVVGAAVAAWLTGFPTRPGLLGLFYAGFATLVWVRPSWFFGIALAAVPMLDLAHWSGRFFLDEHDALLAIGLAIGLARLPAPRPAYRDPFLTVPVLLLAAAYMIGTLRGLWPLQMPDANAFNNYMSPFAGLRIAKGALFAALLWQLWRRACACHGAPTAPLAWGLIAGLAWTAGWIILERIAFTALFDFSGDYRVTGPFSQMHTGGAYVECFIVLTTPFLLFCIYRASGAVLRAGLLACLLAGAFALMVTFSRGGYAAYGLVLAIGAAMIVPARSRQRLAIPGALLLVAAVCAVALPIALSPHAQQRFAGAPKDLETREAHWSDALGIMPTGLGATLFGAGLGRYPDIHYWRSAEQNRAVTYGIQREHTDAFLRLGAGQDMYIDQLVSIDPRASHRLTARVRAPVADAEITVSICRKWQYASSDCASRSRRIDAAPGAWQALQIEFPPNPAIQTWPIKFSVHAPAGKAAIDVTNLVLTGADDRNLIANGNFARGLDHWFFSNDAHLSWHVKNMPLAILFDLGWLGLAGFGWLVSLALRRSGAALLRGDLFAGALFAALCGFLVIGLIDSLVDTPRFLMLFLFLTLLACDAQRQGIAR